MKKTTLLLLILLIPMTILPALGKKDTLQTEIPADMPEIQRGFESYIRINALNHQHYIGEIILSPDQSRLLSCSSDGTAKLWDAETGALLRVFRVPIGVGNEGNILTGAFTADGKSIYLAGQLGRLHNSEEHDLIYRYDVDNGELQETFRSNSRGIWEMKRLPDGKLLLGGVNLGVYDPRTGEFPLEMSKEKMGGDVNSLSVSRDGQFAVLNNSGNNRAALRLFDASLNLLAEKSVLQGQMAHSVEISPDGNRIAVGYRDSSIVQVYSGKNLDLLASHDLSEQGNDSALRGVWSEDGENLLIYGGMEKKENGTPLYAVIPNHGEGPVDLNKAPGVDIRGTQNMLVVKDGFIVTSWSRIYKIRQDGSIVYQRADSFLGAVDDSLSLSPQGETLSFKTTGDNGTEGNLNFSITERSLWEGRSAPATSVREDFGVKVELSRGEKEFKINRRKISTDRDRVLSYAVYDKKKVVIGAGWNTYLFSISGRKIWQIPNESYTLAIAAAPGNEVYATLSLDGIVRWHRIEDGKKILSLYITPDKDRWIMWTPEGFYDCSPGGQELAGLHFNRGMEQAPHFYPLDRFPGFYRPDVLRRVLTEGGGREAALKIAAESAGASAEEVSFSLMEQVPPYLEHISPLADYETDASSLPVRLAVTAMKDSPVEKIRVMKDGSLLLEEAFSLTGPARDYLNLDLPLESGVHEYTFLAAAEELWSNPVRLSINSTAEPVEIEFPGLVLFASGVSEYADEELNLKGAAEAAACFTEEVSAWSDQKAKSCSVRSLVDADADRSALLSGLQGLIEDTGPEDFALLYLTGRTVSDLKGRPYLLPHDGNLDSITSTAIPFRTISRLIGRIKGEKLVVLDIGRKEAGDRERETLFEVDYNGVINQLIRPEVGAAVLSMTGHYDPDGVGPYCENVLDHVRGTGSLEMITRQSWGDAFMKKMEGTIYFGQE